MNVLDIEAQSKIALLGGAFRWQDTPIEVTPAAKATDPLRGLRDGWWKKSEPRYADGREVILIRTRDNAEEEAPFVRQTDKRTVAGEDEFEPQEGETVSAFLGRAAILGGTFWKALCAYAARFRPDASARTLDRNVVASFLKNMRKT